jgi:hypothetical protein
MTHMAHDLVRPPKARRGERIAVLSPSFAAPGDFPAVHEQAMRRLTEVTGLIPVEYPTTGRARGLNTQGGDPALAVHRAVAAHGEGEVGEPVVELGIRCPRLLQEGADRAAPVQHRAWREAEDAPGVPGPYRPVQVTAIYSVAELGCELAPARTDQSTAPSDRAAGVAPTSAW